MEKNLKFKIIKREVITDFGKEIVILKQFNLDKDRWQDRIWIFQPQDPEYLKIKNKLEEILNDNRF